MKHWIIYVNTPDGVKEILVKGERITRETRLQVHQGTQVVGSFPGENTIFQELDPDTWHSRKRIQDSGRVAGSLGETL